MEVVIARFNEDLSFIKDIENDLYVYDKGTESLGELTHNGDLHYASLPNISREDYCYINHILLKYDSFTYGSGHTCFLQGRPLEHCSNLINALQNDLDPENIEWLNTYGDKAFLTTSKQGDNYHRLGIGYLTDILFKDAPDTWLFNPGAQFIVPNHLMTMRSERFWRVCLSLTSYPEAAWMFERIWPLIFDPKVEARW